MSVDPTSSSLLATFRYITRHTLQSGRARAYAFLSSLAQSHQATFLLCLHRSSGGEEGSHSEHGAVRKQICVMQRDSLSSCRDQRRCFRASKLGLIRCFSSRLHHLPRCSPSKPVVVKESVNSIYFSTWQMLMFPKILRLSILIGWLCSASEQCVLSASHRRTAPESSW